MKKLYSVKMGGLTGSLYLYKLGYGYKIIRDYDKMKLGRSYAYITEKEHAMELLKEDMEIITNQLKLF